MTTPSKKSVAPCICGKPDCDIPYGYCHCRCGKKTKIAPYSRRARNWIAGQPQQYLKFHNRTRWGIIDPRLYRKGKVFYRRIPLTQGQYAKVSPHRYDYLMQWKWCAVWSELSQSFIAQRTSLKSEGKEQRIPMHRFILGLGPGDPLTGDHRRSGDTLDNTDENLRPATRQEQQYNKRKPRHNTSGFKCVFLNKKLKKWQSYITVNKKRIHLGLFKTPEDAYAAYCKAARKYYGNFACLEDLRALRRKNI